MSASQRRRMPRDLLRAMFDAAVAAALPDRIVPRHLPAPPKGAPSSSAPARPRPPWPRRSRTTGRGRSRGWSSPATATPCPARGSRSSRRRTRSRMPPGEAAAGADPGAGRGRRPGRSGPVPDLRRRLGAAGAAGPGADARGQAGGQQGAARQRRGHRPDERGPQAPLARSRAAGWPRRRYPAKVVSLLISDVPGDDPAAIASGPTVADPIDLRRRPRRARALPASSRRRRSSRHLDAAREETPKPGDPRLAGVENVMIATPQRSLEAAAAVRASRRRHAAAAGRRARGRGAEVGKVMAGIARSVALHGHPLPPPCVLLSGGETTVTVRGKGRGGRNVEFLLAPGGGAGRAAGHLGDRRRHRRDRRRRGGRRRDRHARHPGARRAPWASSRGRSLADNDGHGFFEALGDQLVTGPTLTNVNDFRAILIQPSRSLSCASE